jgi:hypothetical protein
MEPRRRSRRTLALFLLAAMAGLATASCGGEYREVVEPVQFQARVAQFVGADGNSIGIRLELTAYNPNPFELYAREMDATLAIAGQTIAIARVTFNQMLPPQRPVPVSANIALPRTALAGLASSPMLLVAAGPANIPFSINGNVFILGRRGETRFGVPFNVQGAVARAMFAGMMMPPGGVPMAVPAQTGVMVGGNANTY